MDGFILNLGGGPAGFFAAMFPDPARIILVDIDYQKAVLARKNQPRIAFVARGAERLRLLPPSTLFNLLRLSFQLGIKTEAGVLMS